MKEDGTVINDQYGILNEKKNYMKSCIVKKKQGLEKHFDSKKTQKKAQ